MFHWARTQKWNRIQRKKNVYCHCAGTPVFSVHENNLIPLSHIHTPKKRALRMENFLMKNVCAHAVNGTLVFGAFLFVCCKRKRRKNKHIHIHTITIHVFRVWTENFTEWRTWNMNTYYAVALGIHNIINTFLLMEQRRTRALTQQHKCLNWKIAYTRYINSIHS